MSPPKIKDPRGAHTRMYWDLMDSPAWRSLKAPDQRAYLALTRQKNSFNNGDLSLPFSFAKHHGITNESTLAKSLRALVAVGLVAVTRRTAHRADGSRLPNLYRLTDYAVHPMPGKHIEAAKESNEWKAIKTIAHGRALIRQAEEAAALVWEKEQKRRTEKAEALASMGLKK